MSLEDLNERVRHDLACLEIGGTDWLTPRTHSEGRVYDAVIVGGGQSGLAAAFGLMRERLSNILVIDENPEGREGPWVTYARMVTLRTPKALTSIEWGMASLTFRAWWEAQHGAESWVAMDKIARGDWMDYLRWYRRVLNIPVRNETKLDRIEPLPAQGLHRLHLVGGERLLARKVVLATGIQGGGEWHVPAFIREGLPRNLWAHTSEAIDFAALKGKRIGILGGGASAFDNAYHALEAGVAEVHAFLRRTELPRVNPIRFMERSGLIPRFPALSDAEKYRLIAEFFRHNQPPTNDTYRRATGYPGFRLRLGCPWQAVAAGGEGEGVRVTTPQGTETFDFLILSTGLVSDPALRPELSGLADRIALWQDRYGAPEGMRNPLLDRHPYLGPGFELRAKREEDAPLLHGLFAFNYSALVSLGLSASALSGLKQALPRLCTALADQLFLDDKDRIVADYLAYDEEEFVGQWPPVATGEDA